MAFINYQDPKDGEANSPLIAGITEGLKKISQVLNMEIQTLVDSPMEKVPYYDDNGDEINILYQSPAGNKCWLPSPPPIIKKNGIALTESTYTIDYVGGSIFFSRNSQQLDSDVFTVDVTIIKPSSVVLNESNEKIEDLVSSTASYKGYYETLDELKVAHPRSNLGDFAIIGGEIDTIAVWDKESNDWKMITSDIDLSGYYTKAEVENIKTNLQNNIDNTNTALTEGLAEKVDTTAFDEAMAKKVDTTAFDEKMTAVDTSIAAKADKTLENVSDDDLKKRVQGLDIGGGLKNLKDNLTSDGAIYGVNTVSDPTILGIPQGKNSFQFGEGTISGNNNSMAIGENSIVNFQNTGVPITRIVNESATKKITVGFDFLTDSVKNNMILARDYLNTQGKSFDIYLNAKLITPDDTGSFDFVKVTVSNTDGNNPLNIDMANLDLFIADYDNFVAKYSVDDLSFFVLVGNDELTFANKDNAVSTGFSLGDGNLNQGNLTNSSIVSGSMNVNMSSNSIVGGIRNTVSKSDNSVVTGEANISSGDKYSFLSGNKNNVQNSNSSIVTGTNNFVISSGDSIVSGNTNVVMSDRSIVNGQYNKIFGYSNNLTLGVGNCSNGENVYNIGTNNIGVTTRQSLNSGINIGSGNLSNSACSGGIVESYVVGDTSTTIVVNLDYDFADSPIMSFLKVGDNVLFVATSTLKSIESRAIESIDVDNHSFTIPNFSDTTFVPRAFSAERKNVDFNSAQNITIGMNNSSIYQNSFCFGIDNINSGYTSIACGLDNSVNKNYSYVFGRLNTCRHSFNLLIGYNNFSDTKNSAILGESNLIKTSGSVTGLCLVSGRRNISSRSMSYVFGESNVSGHEENSGIIDKVDSDNNTFYIDETVTYYSKIDTNILVGNEIYISSAKEMKKYKVVEKNGNAIKVDSAIIASPQYFVNTSKTPSTYSTSFSLGRQLFCHGSGSANIGLQNKLTGETSFILGDYNWISSLYSFMSGKRNSSYSDLSFTFGQYNFMAGGDYFITLGTANVSSGMKNSYKIVSVTTEGVVTVESNTTNWTATNFAKLTAGEYVVLTSTSALSSHFKAKIVSIDTTNYTITLDRQVPSTKYTHINSLTNRAANVGYFNYVLGNQNASFGNNSCCIGNLNTIKGAGFVYGESNTIESNAIYSVVIGKNCSVSGNSSFAFGDYVTTKSNYSFAFGNKNGNVSTETSGSYAFAFGSGVISDGMYSFAFGNLAKTTSSSYSFAFGYSTLASAVSSFAFGNYSTAAGRCSFAFGENYNYNNVNYPVEAKSTNSFAFGKGAITEGNYSFAFGDPYVLQFNSNVLRTRAKGSNSFAFGYGADSSGSYSFSFGHATSAKGAYSFAFGRLNGNNSASDIYTEAIGKCSFAFGEGTTTSSSGNYSFAFGILSSSSGSCSFSFGNRVSCSGSYSLSLGSYFTDTDDNTEYNTMATQNHSFAFGCGARTNGLYSLAFGNYATAGGKCSFAFGENGIDKGLTRPIVANGDYAFAFGKYSNALGNYSFAFGSNSGTSANGVYAFAFGNSAIASGNYAFAFGNTCRATHHYSFAFGQGCAANSQNSFAFGQNSVASGTYSVGIGYASRGIGYNSFVVGHYLDDNGKAHSTIIGKYNVLPTIDTTTSGTTGNAFIIGNGTSTSAKSNCFRVQYNGQVFSKGSYSTSGADLAETIEWWDKNPDGEDRRGRFVTLDGNYIKFADTPEQVFGCVSSNPSLIGNNESETWHDMYLKDIWGELILQEVTVPDEYETTYEDYTDVDENGNEVTKTSEVRTLVKESYKTMSPIVNPKYNPDMEYKPRSERKEYCITGREGQIVMCDDGTCEVGKLCNTTYGGYATKSDKGYMVMERIDSSHIKIYFGWIKTNEELGIIS